MRRWFLSYHSPDEKLAARLKSAVERADATLSVFFAPTHLRAGGAWTDQLAQELAQADAFILLIGESGVGKWQVPEYDEALDRWVKSGRTFPLIVVLLQGQTAPGLSFLRQLHWIVTPDPASEKDIARIFDGASGRGALPPELWRYASPYRGLEAMEEKDSDYFFGRTRETIETLEALAVQGRLAVLIGNSGVGKSSLAQAGVLSALKRQAWPDDPHAAKSWPAVFQGSRQWCFLMLKPGAEPIKALVDCFLDTWQFAAASSEREKEKQGWIELLRGKSSLPDLIEATERRRTELNQPKFPAFFLYVDQGEELYARAGEVERRRFSELLAQALSDPRLRVMMSMRSDFLGFLQNDQPLFKARNLIEVPPLTEEGLFEVVWQPGKMLGARFESEKVIDIIAQRAAEDAAKDAGALPLLSYTLDDMWREMQKAGDGVLRLPAEFFELGGVLAERANKFLAEHPANEDAIKRILTLRLATMREDGEPTRRRAYRDEFSDEEWLLVGELAGYPNRLLLTATTAAAGETYAEVAHEAIFKRWVKLKEWAAAEREFLAWRGGLEAARRAWERTADADKDDALLMGFPLTQALIRLAQRKVDIREADRKFIVASGNAARWRSFKARLPVIALLCAIFLGAAAWLYQDTLKDEIQVPIIMLREKIYTLTRTTALNPVKERALKPGDRLPKECTDCPEMVVVPSGRFMMGSPAGPGEDNERARHEVKIGEPFAVAKFALTFAEWHACATNGPCKSAVGYSGEEDDRRPVVNVSWIDAQTYVDWLSTITGKQYRLLSEAEYEYAARAGTETKYPWGDDIMLDGNAMANCAGCGSKWGGNTAPVGSFAANAFGLNDMVGNVWEWTNTCWYERSAGCDHVARGGSWSDAPEKLRSASRGEFASDRGGNTLGFRVARTLADGAGAATPKSDGR